MRGFLKLRVLAVFSLVITAAIAVSVFADELENQKSDISAMTLVKEKPVSPFKVQTSLKVISSRDMLLKLLVSDASQTSGACPYFVKAFQYNDSNKSIDVEIEKGFCPNEQMEISRGEIYWVLPRSIAKNKTNVKLSINHANVGSLKIEGKKIEVLAN